MINSIIIRKLIENDMDEFFSLRLKSLQENPNSFLSSYEEEKDARDKISRNLFQNDIKNVIFGAFVKDQIIGIIGIYQENAVKAVHKCYIWGMYVDPDYRGYGVGKKLLAAAIQHAKEIMECLVINITVVTTNIAAKNLYQKCGFKVWGMETKAMCFHEQYYDELHMSLLL